MNKIKRILDWLEEYKYSTKCKGVVLGISGGKDSTVVAMLAKKVWADNVVGVLMPNGNQVDLDDAIKVVTALNLRHYTVNIGDIVNTIFLAIDNELLSNKDCANIISEKAATNVPPRVRMTILYAIAQTLGYRVIGTGNTSEAFIGWTTKWGDSAYDFNPIYHLSCSEVIEIGKELAPEFGLDIKLIEKSPADGLTGTTDEENFGFTYKELDSYMKDSRTVEKDVGDKILKMHLESAHKRMMPFRITPGWGYALF